MNPALKNVSEHMKELGLGALRHALRLSLYVDYDNQSWSELSTLNAAHAAELLVKARIAAEHPLLIFTQLPKSTQTGGQLLDFKHLFEKGQTLDFHELPERLWAVTGETLPATQTFLDFGKFRNAIQHFGPPAEDASARTLDFVFSVIDPFIHKNWGLYAIDYNEEMGDHYEHIFDTLVSRNIRPLISPDAARVWNKLGFKPDKKAPRGWAKWFRSAMASAVSAPAT
jgi:hypothetical protein